MTEKPCVLPAEEGEIVRSRAYPARLFLSNLIEPIDLLIDLAGFETSLRRRPPYIDVPTRDSFRPRRRPRQPALICRTARHQLKG
jgi:hypothetical protein